MLSITNKPITTLFSTGSHLNKKSATDITHEYRPITTPINKRKDNTHFNIIIFDPYICHAGAANITDQVDHDRVVFSFAPVGCDKDKLNCLHREFNIILEKDQENIIY
jgi:hypothetical protein